ncbi:MAG: NUDIX domain-containing protein [Gemmatimonadetes bacterium]|nr:NUDIX domain-containing protein [Gemmatimonadota bacterium]MBT8403565.1 NUDIX domain-containing protein [Gemmatimonadota bacterium]
MVPSVAVVAHDARGRLLMVRDRATGDWGLPAGAIELGESPIEAARRELREETGFDGSGWRLLGAVGGTDFRHAYPNGDRVEYQITVFSAAPHSVPGDGVRTGIAPSTVDAVPAFDADEIDRVRFFHRRDAPPLRLPYPEGMIWSARG